MQKTIQFSYEEYNSKEELNGADRAVLDAALDAVAYASAQFSHFHVGTAARLAGGEIVTSSNYENTSIMNCAEQSLLLHLHSTYREFTVETIAVTFQNMNAGTNSNFPITPCGKCRQLLLEAEENAGRPMRVIMAGQAGKIHIVNGIHTMLPLSFGVSALQQ